MSSPPSAPSSDAAAPADEPQRVLVFRIGQLGDSVIAVPAMRALRRSLPQASFTLLCDRQIGKSYVLAPDLFEGSGLFEDYILYPFAGGRAGRLAQPLRMGALLARLRRRRFDTVIYLAPSVRAERGIARDRMFFGLTGAKRLIGFEGFYALPEKVPGTPSPAVPHEADLLLARLAASGVPVPPAGEGDMSLGLGPSDARSVDRWRERLPTDGGRTWIGVGPGSKMPSKVWPEDRFREVVARLVAEHDLWPVVVGGPEDRDVGERLLAAWGRGYNAAGALSPRQSSEALRRCRLYLGNDSGAMHLASAAGTPCVAIFSSRDRSGSWFPYGRSHRVLRTIIDCDVCYLVECVDRHMECLLAITPASVLEACREVLGRVAGAAEPRGAGRET